MERQIGRTTGHFIICGWGLFARATVLYLDALGKQVVVVTETSPACRVPTIRRCSVMSPTTASWRPLASGTPMR